jgi:hypothetical protein
LGDLRTWEENIKIGGYINNILDSSGFIRIGLRHSSVTNFYEYYNKISGPRLDTANTLPNLLFVLFFVILVVLLLIVMFYVLCVNVYCHRVSTQLQLTNISISIKRETSYATPPEGIPTLT